MALKIYKLEFGNALVLEAILPFCYLALRRESLLLLLRRLLDSELVTLEARPHTGLSIEFCLDPNILVEQNTLTLNDTPEIDGNETKKVSVLRHIADRLVEVVIVFASVYAAFLLNAYQIRQQDDQRRDQLLAYLERDSDARARGLRDLMASYDRDVHEFLDQLGKGQMPKLEPGTWATNFTGTEAGQFLQSGALDLLSIDTVAQMLDVDSLARSGLAMMAHDERLDDEMIAPHVGEDPTYFYDPATQKLRPQFERYLKELKDGSRFLHTLSEARDQLAARVHLERNEFLAHKTSIFAR